MRRRIRITNESGHPLTTKVTDADTGAPIHGVSAFVVRQDANAPDNSIMAELMVVAEVDVTVDAEVRRYRLNEDTGAMELMSDEPVV